MAIETIFFVHLVQGQWPPAQAFSKDFPVGDHRFVRLTCTQNGALRVEATECTPLESGPLQPTRAPSPDETWGFGVVLELEPPQIRFRQISRTLDSFAAPVPIVLPDPAARANAIDDPRTAFVCAKWVDERNSKYAPFLSPTAPSARIPISPAREIDQLAEAIRGTQVLLEHFVRGERSLATSLRARLRELLVEKISPKGDLKRTGVPLLFRVAARYALALPVYVSPLDRDLPAFLASDGATLWSTNTVTIVRFTAAQVLVDFQEALKAPTFVSWTATGPERQSVEDIIAGAAETLGGAHYDPSIPVTVEQVQRMPVDELIVDIANAAISLARYVLEVARERTAKVR